MDAPSSRRVFDFAVDFTLDLRIGMLKRSRRKNCTTFFFLFIIISMAGFCVVVGENWFYAAGAAVIYRNYGLFEINISCINGAYVPLCINRVSGMGQSMSKLLILGSTLMEACRCLQRG